MWLTYTDESGQVHIWFDPLLDDWPGLRPPDAPDRSVRTVAQAAQDAPG